MPSCFLQNRITMDEYVWHFKQGDSDNDEHCEDHLTYEAAESLPAARLR